MMHCPKCNGEMAKVSTHDGVADRCSDCQGLWFDALEHVDLKGHADLLDTGSARVGAHYNTVDRIKCPVCPNSPMTRMVDAGQPHIWFESCPNCQGRFYDAGEFRDYVEVSLMDILRRPFVKARD